MIADDVVELLKHLYTNQSHVLGSSMSGMVVQEFAFNYTEMVDILILFSTFTKPQYIVENITRGVRDILKAM